MTLSRRLSQLERRAADQQPDDWAVYDIYHHYPPEPPQFHCRIPETAPMDLPGEITRLTITYPATNLPKHSQPLSTPEHDHE